MFLFGGGMEKQRCDDSEVMWSDGLHVWETLKVKGPKFPPIAAKPILDERWNPIIPKYPSNSVHQNVMCIFRDVTYQCSGDSVVWYIYLHQFSLKPPPTG